MSVIAVKINKSTIDVAADSIVVSDSTHLHNNGYKSIKLALINNIIVGGAGLVEENGLIQLFIKTHQPSSPTEDSILEFLGEFSQWKHNKTQNPTIENEYILVIDDKVFNIQGYQITEITTYTAIGAGRDFALSALYLNKSVKTAVDVACNLSVWCEPPIKTLQKRF